MKNAVPEKILMVIATMKLNRENEIASVPLIPNGDRSKIKAHSRIPTPPIEIGSMRRNSMSGTVTIKVKKERSNAIAFPMTKYQTTMVT